MVDKVMTEKNTTTEVKKPATGVVQAFKELEGQKVPEGTTSHEGSIGAIMAKVFQTYPDTVFTQRQFVDRLKISEPFANHQLHALMDKGLVSRVGSPRKYFYSLVKKV